MTWEKFGRHGKKLGSKIGNVAMTGVQVEGREEDMSMISTTLTAVACMVMVWLKMPVDKFQM